MPLEIGRHNIQMQIMQISHYCCLNASVLLEMQKEKVKRIWGHCIPYSKVLLTGGRIFQCAFLLLKGLVIQLLCLVAENKGSLRWIKKLSEFSVDSALPRKACCGICSCPRLSTLLSLQFPTLATRSVQLLVKQLLSCCGLQMEISFRLPC